MIHLDKIAAFSRPTSLGDFDVTCFEAGGNIIFALSKGTLPQENLLVRVQSACLFGEAFAVNSCDCGAQLNKALEIGAAESAFLLIYLQHQEGRGHGMLQKIRVIEVEANQHVDMFEAFQRLEMALDLREYHETAAIIKALNGDLPIRLMTNNPKKIAGLAEHGITVAERVPLVIDPPNAACKRYLQVKKDKMGHLLPDFE